MRLVKTITGLSVGIFMCIAASAQTTNPFTGKYQSVNTNGSVFTDITENQHLIRGTFLMDGVNYQIIATSDGNRFQGKILDELQGKFYDVSSELKGSELHFAITIPELNNRVVDIPFTKQGVSAAKNLTQSSAQPKAQAALNNKEKSPKLIGTWRYTEVLSSGFGGNAASLATDYFVQFKPNGECLSWSGSSAGGSQDVSLESRGNGKVTREEWYTEGNKVTFIDPATREEASITFFAEEQRMMLKGSSSKVYQRVK
jgi:uncharacterized protein YcfL